ncbi:hypothetical protein C0Q70_05001 [Pomacea canaliculata]|uniref:Receptor ligand binding region domain-containing protein n=1 Tax=Pomacea canaliculata TaxID=400727 RepID=A0A2T7PJX5_POMCA|nr:hypothetical protein C0Q70_05001 [Pomacea canaliculata]
MGRKCVTLRVFASILLLGVVMAYEYKMQAGVLGYPGSLDAEIYRQIADFLIKEMEEGRSERDKGHCAMYFDSLIFDTSNGSTFYNSLVKARDSFKNIGVAIAIGPFIDVFASTDYVILHQFHLLTSPAGENAGLMDPQKVVSILPEPKSMATVIADVIHKLQWKNVVLLSQGNRQRLSCDGVTSRLIGERECFACADDFSPVLTLGQKGIQVWPIRLPTRIVSHEDAELRRNLIELRASEKNKFILHSTRRDIVHRVILAVSFFS